MIVTVTNNKGGVGKTTTVANTAAALARKGYKVLAIDLDAQGNLSFALTSQTFSRYVEDAIKERQPLPVYKVSEGLFISPSGFGLQPVGEDLARKKQYSALKEALEAVTGNFDFVLIDCAPAVSALTLNAINASNYVLGVVTADAFATEGIATIEEIAATMKKQTIGYLIANFNRRLGVANFAASNLTQTYGERLFTTRIRNNVALQEAVYMRQSIFDYNAKSNGAKDYEAFAEELLQRIKSSSNL